MVSNLFHPKNPKENIKAEMIQTINIREIAEVLGYRDVRSAKKFCRENNLKIFCVKNTHIQYVTKAEFEFAREKDIIHYLKEKFREDWLNAYQQYASLNLLPLIFAEQKNKEDFSENHEPQAKPEQKFPLDFKNPQGIMSAPMQKSFYVPPNKRIRGLQVVGYCQHCKRNLTRDFCHENGKSLKHCGHTASQYFKAYVFPPNGGNTRKTKKLKAKNYEDAVREAIDFKKEVKGEIDNRSFFTPPAKVNNENGVQTNSALLLPMMERYIAVLSNDEKLVPEFKRKIRTEKHIKDVRRNFGYLNTCLKQNGYDVGSLITDSLNDQMLGKFYSYLLEEKKLSNRSYNKAISMFTSFFNYLTEEGLASKNPFKTIPRQSTAKSKIETISREECEQLLQILQKPELGIQKLSTGETKDLYKKWMCDCVELGLRTGRRNSEVAMMRWSEINEKENYLRVEDFKVNRQKGNTEENKKHIFVPLTKELKNLLVRMGYEKYKGSDKYILAPEETMNRDTIKNFMTRSFSHYYRQLNTGKNLSYKCLRKTYISALSANIGIENARVITKHSSTAVMEGHYLDKRVIAKTAENFEVFGENRVRELQELRNEKKNKEILIER